MRAVPIVRTFHLILNIEKSTMCVLYNNNNIVGFLSIQLASSERFREK